MTTTSVKRPGELEKLTGAFWAHVRKHPELPEPCIVTLNPGTLEVEVQVSTGDAVAHLGDLLLWAYTLDGVTAQWWHTRNEYLHITFRGRAAGVRFRVYGGVPFAPCSGLVRLDADEHEGVSVDEIYALRELLTEQADAAGVVA